MEQPPPCRGYTRDKPPPDCGARAEPVRGGEADTHPDVSSLLSCWCSTLHQNPQEARGERSPPAASHRGRPPAAQSWTVTAETQGGGEQIIKHMGLHSIQGKMTAGLPNFSGSFNHQILKCPDSDLPNYYSVLYLHYGCAS